MKIQDIITEEQIDEGWKEKFAAAGVAGAMALGAGSAHAGWDKNSPEWGKSGLPDHVKTSTQIDKANGSSSIDKDMSSVQGPNADGEYKVVIVKKVGGKKTIQSYVTKNPPQELMIK